MLVEDLLHAPWRKASDFSDGAHGPRCFAQRHRRAAPCPSIRPPDDPNRRGGYDASAEGSAAGSSRPVAEGRLGDRLAVLGQALDMQHDRLRDQLLDLGAALGDRDAAGQVGQPCPPGAYGQSSLLGKLGRTEIDDQATPLDRLILGRVKTDARTRGVIGRSKGWAHVSKACCAACHSPGRQAKKVGCATPLFIRSSPPNGPRVRTIS